MERASEESLLERVETYGMLTLELVKLKVLEAVSNVITSLITRISIIAILSCCALFLSIAVAILLGEALGAFYYGYFIVAGVYLLIGLLFMVFLRKWLKRPVSNMILKQILQ